MTTTSYNVYQQITSVRLASTANLSGNYFNGALNNGVGATLTALSVGSLSIDGVLVEVGDRILIKNQTATNQNGLYVVQSTGSFAGLWMLERAPDFQSVEQLKVGQYFTVGAGDTLAGSMYVLVEPLPDTIGLSNFIFVDVGDTGSPSGPFLLKSANLSDLPNRETGFTNIGLGSGAFLIIDESDFIAGLYTLTNPCPNLILVNATSPGNAVRLPPLNEPQSFIPSQGPVFFIDQGFEGIDVQDSNGAVISPLEAPACEQFILTSDAFPQGVWFVRSFVSTVNGRSGDVVIPEGDVIHQQLWVNFADGLDTNEGGISDPFKTYAAATAFAELSASPTNRYVINLIGDQASTTPLLYPYIDLCWYAGTWTVTGGLSLDVSWDNTVNNEVITITGMKLSGFWAFSWVGVSGNVVRFLDCDHSLTTSGNFLSNAASNTLMIINDTSPTPTGYSSDLFITQSNSYLQGVKINNEIRYDIILDGYALTHYLYDSQIPFGIVLKKSFVNTSTQNVYVKNTPMPTGSPVLEDDLSNVIIDSDSYQNTPTFVGAGTYANIQTVGVNGNPMVIYIDKSFGNDANNGSINAPMKTYEAARLSLIARFGVNLPLLGATIVVIGDQDMTGIDLMFTPGISIEAYNPYLSGFSNVVNVVLDPTWGTDFSQVQVRNVYIYITGNYNFIFPAIDPSGSSLLKFVNCQFNTGGFITITGAGGVGIENVTFENCTVDFLNYTPGFTAENVNLYLINTDLTVSVITMTVSTALGRNYILAINDARFYTDDITVITNSTDTLTTYINACNTMGKTLTIDGNLNTVNVDSTSYMFTLALAGGATLANLILPTKTDGMTNSSFTPLNYTPAGGTLFSANTLTGNLKGIDNSLAGKASVIPYQETSSLTNVMVANNEYTANAGSVVSLTLPITAVVGSTIRVNGKGAGGWRIDQQNAGHVIHVGAASTTVGAGGSLASATQFASITLRCITANDVWEAISFAGTFTPV
jgi:hypothetical protein